MSLTRFFRLVENAQTPCALSVPLDNLDAEFVLGVGTEMIYIGAQLHHVDMFVFSREFLIVSNDVGAAV